MRPPLVRVSALPAAIPATCVPWDDSAPSKASDAPRGFGPAGGKARATMTFAVVKRVCPLGKPGGIVYPAGSKNGWLLVDPGVDDPDLHPLPQRPERGSPQRRRADLARRPVERRSVEPSLEHIADACDLSQPRARRLVGARRRSRSRRAGTASAPAPTADRVSSARLNERCSASMRARVPGASASAGDVERDDDLGPRAGRGLLRGAVTVETGRRRERRARGPGCSRR